jgi:hypothetical protein
MRAITARAPRFSRPTARSEPIEELSMRWKNAATVLVVPMLLAAALAEEPKSSPDAVKLSLPGKSWSLVLNLPGFSVEKNEVQPDGRRYMLATNSATGVVISTYLEKVNAPADLEGCKATLEKRAKANTPFKKLGMSIFDLTQMKVLEYFVPEFEGRRVRQKNFFVCLPKEDVFVDIHLSKAGWQVGQEKLFAVILANLRFEENPASAVTP